MIHLFMGSQSEFSYSFLTCWLHQHYLYHYIALLCHYTCFIWFGNYFYYPNSMKSSLKYIQIWNWKYLRNTHIYVCMLVCITYSVCICVYLYIQIYVYVSIYSLVHGNEFHNNVQPRVSSSIYPFSRHLFPFSCQDHPTSAFMFYINLWFYAST